MLVFKKLSRAIRDTNKNLILFKSSEDTRLIEEKKLSALKEIEKYMVSLAWLTREDAKQKLKALLDSDFNYKLVSDTIGVNIGSLQSSASQMSKNFERIIGTQTIDMILDGYVDSAMLQFRLATGNFDIMKELLPGIVDFIPPARASTQFSFQECVKEIRFFAFFSKFNMVQEMKKFDLDKLAFIRYIIEEADEKFTYHRQIIYKYMVGELTSVKKAVAMLDGVEELAKQTKQ